MKGEQGEKLIKQRVEHMERERNAPGIDTQQLWKRLNERQQPATAWKPWRTLCAAAILLVAAGVGMWLLSARPEPDPLAGTVMPDTLPEYSTQPADMMRAYAQDTDMEFDIEDDATAGLYASPDALMANDATADPQLIYN